MHNTYFNTITSGVGYVQKNSQNKNTLSEFFLPLQMHVQNHERVQNFCFYPFRKKLKENPDLHLNLQIYLLFKLIKNREKHNNFKTNNGDFCKLPVRHVAGFPTPHHIIISSLFDLTRTLLLLVKKKSVFYLPKQSKNSWSLAPK